jgi:hypothetical protein
LSSVAKWRISYPGKEIYLRSQPRAHETGKWGNSNDPSFQLNMWISFLIPVEEDYTLPPVDSSPQALQNGVTVPGRLTPDLAKRLQNVLKYI